MGGLAVECLLGHNLGIVGAHHLGADIGLTRQPGAQHGMADRLCGGITHDDILRPELGSHPGGLERIALDIRQVHVPLLKRLSLGGTDDVKAFFAHNPADFSFSNRRACFIPIRLFHHYHEPRVAHPGQQKIEGQLVLYQFVQDGRYFRADLYCP